ncbi:unnamed protein product [Prunus brigantina]
MGIKAPKFKQYNKEHDLLDPKIYICLAQLRKKFINGCKTMIGFDGAHIKGPRPCQILSVVEIDANNDVFPIAYAIAETERRVTWT